MHIHNQKIRVRFAPSPTGQLHIGSARTAFYNWVFAKKNKGSFIIRIEDTDLKRHVEGAIDTLLDSLAWLGLDWDEGPKKEGSFGPYRQSERLDIYRGHAQKLLDEGKAYRCFCSAEELKEKREKNKQEKSSFEYDGKCLNLSQKEIDENLRNNKEFAIRIRVEKDRLISFADSVYGKIEIKGSAVDDFIILRSSGIPTYNFSTAIDDHLMKITHVIRGEDHLSNTPRQILVYDALGFEYPEFTHLPMILGSDGSKLSKRHGSVSIEQYRQEGFAPKAVLNCIALLGWAYDDKTTIFETQEMIAKFELEDINKKPARFDYEKLLHINSSYLRDMDDFTLAEILLSEIEKLKNPANTCVDYSKEKIIKMAAISKARARTYSELALLNMPFFSELNYDNEEVNIFKSRYLNAKEILFKCFEKLELISEKTFSPDMIETALRQASSELGLSFKKTAENLRIALWASPVSLPLFETIEILGKDKTLQRLKNFMNTI